MKTSGVSIRGIAATTPTQREDNLELEILDQTQREKLVETTGIRYRYVSQHQSASDLCEDAATRLLKSLEWNSTDIDLLVMVTQTPDMPIPGAGAQLQHRLGLKKSCLVLDLNQGCAGYVYGLSVASGMMQSMGLKRALLLVGDTITQHISADNASLRPIFSDAGTATALEQQLGAEIQFAFEVHGERFETICLPMKDGKTADLQMNGHGVFSFGLKEVTQGLNAFIKDYYNTESIDFLVMHQANKLLNDAIARKLGIPTEKVPSTHYDFGNTSCATIPLTIAAQLGTEAFIEKKTVMLAGFGVGLTWGGAILELQNVLCLPIEHI